MTPHVVPHGWERGQQLRQHGVGRLDQNDRYHRPGPFPPGQSIAICQDLGWPPDISRVVDPETIYAVTFHDAEDVNQWLDWWFGETRAAVNVNEGRTT